MYALFRSLQLRQIVIEQLPAIAGAMAIAEFFYKFGSFTLECLAFLATWFVIDLCLSFLSGAVRRGAGKAAHDR